MSTATIDQAEQTQRKIPAAAARFDAAGMFEFAASEEGKAGRPVRLHARDSQPVAHWYWGKIAHDMAGVIHKGRLAIDWCHDRDQILGYVDQVAADNKKGLDLAGAILTDIDEKAAEVAAKADAGVPYESSIDWTGPAVLEWVETGMKAEVNGYTFEGPGYIARKWHLRGVAICPHGVDMSTTTEFSGAGDVAVTVFSQHGGVIMPTSQSQQATQDSAEPANGTNQAATRDAQSQTAGTAPTNQATVDATKDSQPELKAAIPAQKFVDSFGPQLGYRFYGDGLSYEDAAVEFGKAVAAQRDALAEENKQLKAQIATLRGQMGEAEPATFTPEGGKAGPAPKAVDDNLAKFKAGIKLPGRDS